MIHITSMLVASVRSGLGWLLKLLMRRSQLRFHQHSTLLYGFWCQSHTVWKHIFFGKKHFVIFCSVFQNFVHTFQIKAEYNFHFWLKLKPSTLGPTDGEVFFLNLGEGSCRLDESDTTGWVCFFSFSVDPWRPEILGGWTDGPWFKKVPITKYYRWWLKSGEKTTWDV